MNLYIKNYVCPKCHRPVTWIPAKIDGKQHYLLEWNCQYCGEMIIDFRPLKEFLIKKDIDKF